MQATTRPIFLSDNDDSFIAQEERINRIEHLFVCSLKNLNRHFDDYQIYTAITGGRDSRVTLSMLHKSGIPYKGFTFWHDNISKEDIIIPKKLSKLAGINYKFIGRSKRIKDLQYYVRQQEHCGGLTAERTWESVQQLEELKEHGKVVIIRSGIFEMSCDYYHVHPNNALDIYPRAKCNSVFEKSIDFWKKMIKEDCYNTEINLSDRFYYDQRLGCWLSSTEQSFDIYDDIISIQICNNRIILSLLMGFPTGIRKNKFHEEMLSVHAFPTLAKIKYDYQYVSIAEKIRH